MARKSRKRKIPLRLLERRYAKLGATIRARGGHVRKAGKRKSKYSKRR